MIYYIALINILWIWGFYVACKVDFYNDRDTSQGYDEDSRMVLWQLKKSSLELFGPFWSKPICTCPPCMSSLHSLPFFLLYCGLINAHGLQWVGLLVFVWPVYAASLCAVNYFVSLLVNKLDQ